MNMRGKKDLANTMLAITAHRPEAMSSEISFGEIFSFSSFFLIINRLPKLALYQYHLHGSAGDRVTFQ
jgi:hypothetical protein